MPLTPARIAELRRGTAAFPPSAEMVELLDAALAWSLYAEHAPHATHGPYWAYTAGLGLTRSNWAGQHPTPQAAVLRDAERSEMSDARLYRIKNLTPTTYYCEYCGACIEPGAWHHCNNTAYPEPRETEAPNAE